MTEMWECSVDMVNDPGPEWDGPDPLMEMVKNMHRMVPESRVAKARAAVLRELREEVAGMDGWNAGTLPGIQDCVPRAALLEAIDRRLGG